MIQNIITILPIPFSDIDIVRNYFEESLIPHVVVDKVNRVVCFKQSEDTQILRLSSSLRYEEGAHAER